MHLHGHKSLHAHASQLLTAFITKSGYNPKNSRGVSIKVLPLVEEKIDRKRLIYNFDIQEEEKYRELARRRIRKVVKTMKLLRCNNHIIQRNNTDTFDFPAVTVSSTDQTTSTDIFQQVKI